MLEHLLFQPDDQKLLERAVYAAPFLGRATAMVVNLHRADQLERMEIWGTEVDVWQKRLNEAWHQLPHQDAVAEELEVLIHKAYTANLASIHQERLGITET